MAHQEASDRRESDHRHVSRRRLLKAGAGTALTAGFAGCSGGGDGPTSTTDDGGDATSGSDTSTDEGGDEGGEPVDSRFTSFSNPDPSNSHYNPYNPSQYAGAYVQSLLYNQLWVFNSRSGEYHPRIGKSMSIDGTTATVEIDRNFKWAGDGSQVSATELAKQLQLEKFIDYPVWNFIDGAEAEDEATLTVDLKESYNPSIFRQTLNRHLFFKEGSEYDEWLGKMQDASDDELDAVVSEFQKWAYAKDSNDPIANGPYQIGKVTSTKFILDQNENYPYENNIPQYELNNVTSDQQTWQMAISDELDGSGNLAVPSDILEQFPDHLEQIKLPGWSCYSPMFQFDHPVWGKREARQGYMYLLDRELVDRNINPRHKPMPYVSGLDTGVSEQFLGDEWIDQNLVDYGVKSEPEKAAEKFREAGFSKSGDQWVDGDGNPITLHWLGPQFPGSVGFDETLSQIFPDFGIDYESTLVSAPQWISQRKKGDFDLTFNYIGGGPHPYYFLQATVASTRSKFGNWPRETVELPPIGQPDGSLQEVDLTGLLNDMLKTKSDSELSEYAKQHAWYINQELPVVPMTTAEWIPTMSFDDWQAPSPDSDLMGMREPFHQLLRETEDGSDKPVLQAKTK